MTATGADSSAMSEEQLILVDERNRATGSAGKTAVHRGGLLHRAFSIFVVDDRGRIMLQRRNPQKYHSGGLWANSCCGHPRPGERTITAAHRRLDEELGVTSDLSFGFFRALPQRARSWHARERIRLRLFRTGPVRAAAESCRGRRRRVPLLGGHKPAHRAQARFLHGSGSNTIVVSMARRSQRWRNAYPVSRCGERLDRHGACCHVRQQSWNFSHFQPKNCP